MARYDDGFTIIETALFLAVSSMLAVTLLVGTSMAIQRQQYRDSVQSFAGFLRDQYSRVINVENDRTRRDSCPISGAGSGSDRGQSDCVIVGRYIETAGPANGSDGRVYDVYPIYALQTGGGWRYAFRAQDKTSYEVNWGARTRLAQQGRDEARLSIIMYRDPQTSQLLIRTDSRRLTNTTLAKAITDTDLSDTSVRYQICVYDDDWLTGERQSVFLNRYAGSSDAVTIEQATGGCR